MIKSTLQFILIFLTTSMTDLAHAGPMVVGSGAGLSEYFVMSTHSRFGEMLQACERVSCSLTPSERQTLSEIDRNLASPLTPIFKTEQDLPGLKFKPVQTQVWINADRLWKDVAKTVPFEPEDAFELWLEIYASTLDAKIDSLSMKLIEALRTRSAQVTLSLWSKNDLSFQVIHQAGQDTFSLQQRQLSNGHDLTKPIFDNVNCPLNRLSSLKYVSGQWLDPIFMKTGQILLRFQFQIALLCDGQEFRSRLLLAARATSGGELLPSTVQVFKE